MVGGFHLLLNGTIALISARLVGARAVYSCCGGWCETWGGGARSENRLFGKLGRDSRTLERSLFRIVEQFDLILTRGSKAQEYFRQRGIKSPLAVVAGGIDPSRFRRSDAEDRKFDVIFVGRLVRVKRLDILLRVIAKVASDRPNVRAVIVGDGPLRRELQTLATVLRISRNVSFVGHHTDIAPWLRQARIFMLTSDTEGLALSLLEASMAGLPAIVSDVGELGDVVSNGQNGWRVPRRDVEAFARKLNDLLSNRRQWETFSLGASRMALRYSTQSISDRWDHLFPCLLGDSLSPTATAQNGTGPEDPRNTECLNSPQSLEESCGLADWASSSSEFKDARDP